MKIRLGAILVLLLTLAALVMRNDERILHAIYALINPLKQQYIAFTEKLEAEGESYLFQKKTIDRLRAENEKLRVQLLEQIHYIEQLKEASPLFPELSSYVSDRVVPVHAISYIKLNSFSRIVLTKPEGLNEDNIYGLVQRSVAAGIAVLKHDQLYGYLVSDPECRFAVYVGDKHAPGIAQGAGKNRMVVKFIPKWYDIKKGDAVVTSGLDNIFFSSVPVGIVESVQTQSAYKVAYLRVFADIYHPKLFFLIKDATKNIVFLHRMATKTYEKETNLTKISKNHFGEDRIKRQPYAKKEANATVRGDIPSKILQTRDDVVEPDQPVEHRPKQKPKPRKKRRKPKPKKKVEPVELDLF